MTDRRIDSMGRLLCRARDETRRCDCNYAKGTCHCSDSDCDWDPDPIFCDCASVVPSGMLWRKQVGRVKVWRSSMFLSSVEDQLSLRWDKYRVHVNLGTFHFLYMKKVVHAKD